MATDGTCALCGSELSPEQIEAGASYCAACAVEAAERHLPSQSGPNAAPIADDEARAARRKRNRNLVLGVMIVVFIAATAFAVPQFVKAASLRRPLREGVTNTDAATDACIENLWKAANDYQNTGGVASELVCPETGEAYRVTKTGENVVIACPDPSTHGLSVLEIEVGHGGPRAVR